MPISIAAQTELDRRFRAAAIIVASQLAAAILLLIFGFLFVKTAANPASLQTLMPLWVGVLFIALGTFLLRRRLYNWDRLKDISLLRGTSGLLQTLQHNAIFLGALAELIVVIGVVITFLSGNVFEILRAGAIALVVFAVNFPRKSMWTKIAAGLENT